MLRYGNLRFFFVARQFLSQIYAVLSWGKFWRKFTHFCGENFSGLKCGCGKKWLISGLVNCICKQSHCHTNCWWNIWAFLFLFLGPSLWSSCYLKDPKLGGNKWCFMAVKILSISSVTRCSIIHVGQWVSQWVN